MQNFQVGQILEIPETQGFEEVFRSLIQVDEIETKLSGHYYHCRIIHQFKNGEVTCRQCGLYNPMQQFGLIPSKVTVDQFEAMWSITHVKGN